MKKITPLVILICVAYCSYAQTRVSLLEEFTGENCGPCAAYNPGLDALLSQSTNSSKIIALKWQVPIPSAPSNSASLYQTNKPEINYRYQNSSSGGYGYQNQATQGGNLNNGIMNAPTCLIDGQNQWIFGAVGNHPSYTTNNVINSAAAVSTPFSINLATSWNANFSNCIVTVTITTSSAFTSAGNLMLRLCLVERYVKFQTPPGNNGEKIFHDVVRKSYPVTTLGSAVTGIGTVLPSSWLLGQTQVLTINCPIPSYIIDKSQMAFVGFIQDDGNQKVYQATRTSTPLIPNDAKAAGINLPLVVCSNTIIPSVTINNNGPNGISSVTITPFLDGIAGANVIWSGSLSPNSSTTLPLNLISLAAAGSHTYAYSISGVSGGDIATSNNYEEFIFTNASSYISVPLSEGFEGTSFPPQNWILASSGLINNFELSQFAGGYGTSSYSAYYPLHILPSGEVDELYLPPSDLIGTLGSELKFDLAYQQMSSSTDSLFVFLSSDCGANWTKIYADGGASMITGAWSSVIAVFYPSNNQWKTITIPLTGYTNSPNVLFKFKIKTGGGNGLYLDNINLKAGAGTPPNTTGIGNVKQNESDITIYPNPAIANAIVEINSDCSCSMNLKLENSLGQIIYSNTKQLSAGSNSVDIDCRDLSSGVYFVIIQSKNNGVKRKLLISR